MSEPSLLLSPNPASDRVRLNITGLDADSELRIHDATGKLIQTLMLKTDTTILDIDLRDGKFESGMYIVSMMIGGQLFIEKLIVQE